MCTIRRKPLSDRLQDTVERHDAVPLRLQCRKKKAPGFSKLWISESGLTARGGTGWEHRLVFLRR
jgi:hypothetical protein